MDDLEQAYGPSPEAITHPANCVCIDCEADRKTSAVAKPAILMHDPAADPRANGHPANCLCVTCQADVVAGLNIQRK